jgi:hypothetical protein
MRVFGHLPGKLHTIPSDFDSQCFKDLMVVCCSVAEKKFDKNQILVNN